MAAKKTFSHTFVTGARLLASQLNTLQEEVSAEFEARSDELSRDGVVSSSSLAPTITGTSVTLSAGNAYVFGKYYENLPPVEFNGRPAGTYYGYIDDASESVQASTSKPSTTSALLLFSVFWNGTTLSDLVDLRLGVLKQRVSVVSKSSAYAITGVDDLIAADATGGEVELLLPPAGDFRGAYFTVIKTDGSENPVTVLARDEETINGAESVTVRDQHGMLIVFSDSTQWIAVVVGPQWQSKVTGEDPIAGYLSEKLVPGDNITMAVATDSETGEETLEVASTAPPGLILTEQVSGSIPLDLIVGDGPVEVVFNHADQAIFEKIVQSQAGFRDENGNEIPGVRVRKLIRTQSGELSSGEQLCLEVEAPGDEEDGGGIFVMTLRRGYLFGQIGV